MTCILLSLFFLIGLSFPPVGLRSLCVCGCVCVCVCVCVGVCGGGGCGGVCVWGCVCGCVWRAGCVWCACFTAACAASRLHLLHRQCPASVTISTAGSNKTCVCVCVCVCVCECECACVRVCVFMPASLPTLL